MNDLPAGMNLDVRIDACKNGLNMYEAGLKDMEAVLNYIRGGWPPNDHALAPLQPTKNLMWKRLIGLHR